MVTRRQFLRGAAALAATAVTGTGASAIAAEASAEPIVAAVPWRGSEPIIEPQWLPCATETIAVPMDDFPLVSRVRPDLAAEMGKMAREALDTVVIEASESVAWPVHGPMGLSIDQGDAEREAFARVTRAMMRMAVAAS